MQPMHYKPGISVIGWYVSEKYDGVKGRWIDGKMYLRSGTQLSPPKEIVDLYTSIFKGYNVEGELYFGKETFHLTGSLRKASTVRWNSVVFMVFDLIPPPPKREKGELTWLERQLLLKKLLTDNESEKVVKVKWKKVHREEELKEFYENVIANGGEGVVIANPKGLYTDGYSESILKWKAKLDSEATIIGYRTDDEGEKLHSLLVKEGNLTFHIGNGFKKTQRYRYKELYPIGCTVTYKYELLSKTGKPRAPILKGVRTE